MRLFRLRRWSRAVATVLLLAALPGVSHLAEDDAGCTSPIDGFERHDETQHGIRPADLQHPQEHCAICHWSRSLRAPRPVHATLGRLLQSSSPVLVLHDSAELMLALDRAPARAPPAA